MKRKYYCICPQCSAKTEFKDLKDEYTICKDCHRILNISGDLYVYATTLTMEKELDLATKLNQHNKSKTLLLEGDDLLNDFI